MQRRRIDDSLKVPHQVSRHNRTYIKQVVGKPKFRIDISSLRKNVEPREVSSS